MVQNKLNWETAQLIQLLYPRLQRLTTCGHLLSSPRADGSPESVLASGAVPTGYCRLWVGYAVFLLYRHSSFYCALLCCALQMLFMNWGQDPPPAKKEHNCFIVALAVLCWCGAEPAVSLRWAWVSFPCYFGASVLGATHWDKLLWWIREIANALSSV